MATIWDLLLAVVFASLGWSADFGWRVLRASPMTRIVSGGIFVLAIAGTLIRPGVAITVPLSIAALGLYSWSTWLGRRYGASGRRFRVMSTYARLLRLRDENAPDLERRGLELLGSLPADRDQVTSSLIDAMLEAWPYILARHRLHEASTEDVKEVNSATERMNLEAARMFR